MHTRLLECILEHRVPTSRLAWVTEEDSTSQTPRAIVTADNRVWVFWTSKPNALDNTWLLEYSTYRRSTQTWTPRAQLARPTYQPTLQLRAGPQGDLWVFWYAEYDPSDSERFAHWMRFDAAAGLWTGEARIPVPLRGYADIATAVDREGGLWLFWTSDSAGAHRVRCRRLRTASNRWSAATQISRGPGNDRNPFVCATFGGGLLAAWLAGQEPKCRIRYRLFTWKSQTWQPTIHCARELPRTDNASIHFPTLVSHARHQMLLWAEYQRGNFEIWSMVGQWQDASNLRWYPPLRLRAGHNGLNLHPLHLTVGGGHTYIAWWEAFDGLGKGSTECVRRADGPWSPVTNLRASEHDMSLNAIVDNDGVIWVFSEKNGRIAFRRVLPEICNSTVLA